MIEFYSISSNTLIFLNYQQVECNNFIKLSLIENIFFFNFTLYCESCMY